MINTLLYTFLFSIEVLTQFNQPSDNRKGYNATNNYLTIGDYIDDQNTSGTTNKDFESNESDRLEDLANIKLLDSQKNKPSNYQIEMLTRQAFVDFKKEFSILYSPMENEYRYGIFKRNLQRILDHNRANSSYKMSINKFSALGDQEFKDRWLNAELPIKGSSYNERRLQEDVDSTVSSRLKSLPAELNWARLGFVSPVKNQDECQGCYIFSAIAGLESAIMIKHKRTIILSEQEILDCSYGFGNRGCIGGQPAFVYDYIKKNGINLLMNYPYKGFESQCKAPTKLNVFKGLISYIKLDLNIISILEMLQYGPVVVNHNIPDDFKYYSSGIFNSVDCHHTAVINHSSIVVGYNFNVNPPYFLLKNSWGVRWGEAGYYKVKIGSLSYKNPGFCYLASNDFNVFPIV